MQAQTPKLNVNRYIKDAILIAIGVLSASIGLKGFLLPNDFLDGGVTGISLLTKILTGYNLSILIIVINIPFILISIKQISKEFAVKTTLAIIGLAIAIKFIEIPPITADNLLIAVFGGFFLGLGIGLAIRGGSVIDGTEVLAIYVSRRSNLTVGDFIGLFNIILFSLAAFLVSFETAMYSILTYLAASKTVDFIINGIEEYIGLTNVYIKADTVKNAIVHKLGRGVTVYKAESGFGKHGEISIDRKVLYCVVTRLEVTRLLEEINLIDPEAFVVQNVVKDTKGGMIKKRPLH